MEALAGYNKALHWIAGMLPASSELCRYVYKINLRSYIYVDNTDIFGNGRA